MDTPDCFETANLNLFAESAYLSYAMSVVKSRALPSVEDGQKPVHRRILFAMREMGSRADSPYKKSARIVGDVIGKYHPHGDSAVYEAAVRMAQDFTLRYPLIDGQGNFGSRDGDSAAAMRYTEVRLTKFAEDILLSELDRGTVDFRDNYDGSMREPISLPAKLPVLLLNGSSGIAVGMATEMPSHNLVEIGEACIHVIGDPDCNDDEICSKVSGPDYTSGGQIISTREEIQRAYSTGRGSLRVRSKWDIEPLAKGQYRIAITEIPPGTSVAKVLAEIEEMSNPRIKTGKKALSPDQMNTKASVMAILSSAGDDSDQAHPVRLVLEPKSSKTSPDEIMNFMLANTSLESNAPINMTLIGLDGRPGQKSLPAILREWCASRMMVVERRLAFRLDEVDRRMHILNGRRIAFLNIEQVIRVIREADNPKADLMEAFGLSEIQADDILEIRLRQLARLEGIKIQSELDALAIEQGELQDLLSDEIERRLLVIEEIRQDIKKYGDPRRTLIQPADRVTASRIESIVDEPVTIILSRNGFIRQRVGHGIDISALTWKDGDGEMTVVETRSAHPVILVDNRGRAYTLRSQDIPGGKGDGAPVTSLADIQQAKVIAIVSSAPETMLLVVRDDGYGFRCKLSDMVSRQRSGKQFLTLDDNATLLATLQLHEESTSVACLSAQGRLLVFPMDEIKQLSGGKGIILMGLDEGEKLSEVMPFSRHIEAQGQSKSGKAVTCRLTDEDGQVLDIYVGHRARKGKKLPTELSQTKLVATNQKSDK